MAIRKGGLIGAIIAAAGIGAYSLIPGAWNKLQVEGRPFQLSRVQDVRFGAGTAWVYKYSLTGGGVCTVAYFGGTDPAPGQAKRCEAKWGAPTPPPQPPGQGTDHRAGMPVADPSLWPALQPGVTDVRLSAADPFWLTLPYPTKATFPAAGWDNSGDIRPFCNTSKFGYDDPIVLPNQPNAAHHHTFFANTAIDAFTTTDDIRTRNSPKATCRGGTINLSAYWVPSMLNASTVPLAPHILVYYKTGFWPYLNNDPAMAELPLGLRMVSGNATRSTPGGIAHYTCHYSNIDFNIDPPDGNTSAIPTYCPRNSPSPDPNGVQFNNWPMQIWQFVQFFQCWNGQLDSPNHKDHLADIVSFYTGVPERAIRCPTTHPYVIIQITLIPEFDVGPGGATGYHLASDTYLIASPSTPAGYSGHGDWMNGWDPAVVTQWTDGCSRRLVNCGSFVLGYGDGRTSLEFQGN